MEKIKANLETNVSSSLVTVNIWARKETIKPFLLLIVQLALAGYAIFRFNIEAHLGLPKLMFIALIAFIINALLPKENRISFFFFASLIPIYYFFGWRDGSLLTSIAVLMIGTCHLPIALSLRRLILVLLAGALAFTKYYLSGYMMEKGAFPEGFSASSQMISVLATMFMFRMIIYMYELKYEKESASVWHRLSYFFMLPNICFPIFPIVDYKTFNKTYYNEDDLAIYQKGMNLIALGIIQLLVYRVLYYLTPSAQEVDGFWILLRYLFLSYLMLFRLNGILNIAVGILRLFGFNLPDIFNYMYLARGFDDLWRRVNIYWKDFMVKVVYYPLYFKFKKKGKIFALVVGTIITFVLNWAFHAYQWFWILGEFPVRFTELLAWVLLGFLVLVSILKQQGQTSKKKSESTDTSFRIYFNTAVSILRTFILMTLIHSLMLSPSLASWLKTLSNVKQGSLLDWGIVLFGGFLILGTGSWLLRLVDQKKLNTFFTIFKKSNNVAFLNVFLLAIIIFSSSSMLNKTLKGSTGFSTDGFVNHHLNLSDQRKQFNGYYEELMFADNFSSVLWQMEYKKPVTWLDVADLELLKNTGYLLELEPSSETIFKKGKLTTNRWGFRDKDYTKKRPPGTMRFAVLGGSPEMGAGVNDEEVFDRYLEEKLNREKATDSSQVEILNFAISGMSVLRHIEKLRLQVVNFQPQTILVFAHHGEDRHIHKSIKWFLDGSGSTEKYSVFCDTVPWIAPFMELLEREEITYSQISTNRERSKGGWKVVQWGYQEIKEICDQKGMKMIMVFNPGLLARDKAELPFQRIAAELNIPFVDLNGCYDGYSIEELQIAPWDNHPNAVAHQILADTLYTKLLPYLK